MREIQLYLGPKFIVPQHNMESLVSLVGYTATYIILSLSLPFIRYLSYLDLHELIRLIVRRGYNIPVISG